MTRQSSHAYLAIREERAQKLAADYRKFIKNAIAESGNEQKLSRELGQSVNYVRESLRGGLSGLKTCAELIGGLG